MVCPLQMYVNSVDDLRLMEMGIIPGMTINVKRVGNHYLITFDNTILALCENMFSKIK